MDAMTPEKLNEVWAMLDREHLASIVCRGPSPVFATISGAHLYGFASPDSDVDLRGAFLLPARTMLGLRPPIETITIEEKGAVALDWVAHDIRKFARMMLNHNGYVLEQLYSPLVVYSSPLYAELLELGKGCVTRPTVRHYLGFARGRRQRLAAPEPTIKHLLYAYRVLLTGIHLMQSGEVLSNIIVLNERFRIKAIEELVARKRSGTETMLLSNQELTEHTVVLDQLKEALHEAHEASRLPEEATSAAALDDFVVRIRLEAASLRES